MNRRLLALCGVLVACGNSSSSNPTTTSDASITDVIAPDTRAPSDGGPTDGGTGNPVSVLTNRYDQGRTGSQTAETFLTPAALTAGNTFGLLYTRPVDGTIQAQPLYMPGLTIDGAKHNVVFVATENDSVYAFDADDPTATMPLWHTSLGTAFPLSMSTFGCTDLVPEVGVSATPVIDPASGTIYIATQQDGTNQKLHALDVTTGAEKMGSPVQITAPTNWDPSNLFSRVGLLLSNGTVYAAFASHCDYNPYKGWVFAIDATSLAI